MLETSFGILPLRRSPNGWEILLIRHQAGHWAFPKGHAEPDESGPQAAERELFEETQLTISRYFPTDPVIDRYTFQRSGQTVAKEVVYFLAEVSGSVHLQEKEVSDYRWARLKKAETHVTFPETQQVCRESVRRMEGLTDDFNGVDQSTI